MRNNEIKYEQKKGSFVGRPPPAPSGYPTRLCDYDDYEKLHEFLRTFVWDYEVDYERTLGLDRVNIRRN